MTLLIISLSIISEKKENPKPYVVACLLCSLTAISPCDLINRLICTYGSHVPLPGILQLAIIRVTSYN